jgi:membrane protein YdbS with pleckstrin-like domain
MFAFRRWGRELPDIPQGGEVALILLILILAIVLAGLGFAVHLLWWLAIIVAIIWALGFVFRGGTRRRWYNW